MISFDTKKNLHKKTNIVFQPIHINKILHTSNVDLLWNLNWMFKNPIFLWPGYMKLILKVHSKDENKKDIIDFLLTTHCNSSDIHALIQIFLLNQLELIGNHVSLH